MNVKIDNQNIRFKISERELNSLLTKKPIQTKLTLTDNAFVTTIYPADESDVVQACFVQNENETHIKLYVPSSQLQGLLDMGRSRKGLEEIVNGLSISLQVDVRQDSRQRKNA